MKIGLFGGSFDPVHHGHLMLARDAVEEAGLDEIRLMPAARNPLKGEDAVSSGHHRMAMLEMAVEEEPGLIADDWEVNRPPPSYTIETLRNMRERFPEAELYLVIGADNLAVFHAWKANEEILQLAQLLVFGRTEAGQLPDLPHQRLGRRIDLSSTEIRRRVAMGKSIRYLVPPPVSAYVAAHHLYRFEPILP